MSNAKIGMLKKAYSNVHTVMDVLYAVKEKNIEYPPFDYGDPIQFLQTHVIYISVFRGALNPHHVMQLKNHRLKHEYYLPKFMRRPEKYIYKEAYVVTRDMFGHTFLRDFAFQRCLAYPHRGR